ncbi:MAG TPA: alcohol dehydrogenase catalytic domain-containing protein [Acidimicrobiales bacterium]|nr:alcohol dehydrogenase catalytic domain-containing protein [Acidimicrobiales bacterium]
MRAVTIVDGNLVWEERADPVPAATELLVRVRAAGINNADLLQRQGFYPPPPGFDPDVPGMELAGEVVGAGERASRFSVGDRVMAVVGGGAQAELAVVDESVALAVPESIGWEEAGGFPEAFSTAFDALFTQCAASVGDRVLVTGAAGGVGTAVVQLAARAGALVFASVRSPHLRGRVVGLGAREAVDPGDAGSFGPFDVLIELVGASSLASVLGWRGPAPSGRGVSVRGVSGPDPTGPRGVGALATNFRVSVIGVGGGGGRMELDLLGLMNGRGRISGSTLRPRPLAEKAVLARSIDTNVVPLLGSGDVKVPVTAAFPMERATDAYELFSSGGKFGKIVLVAG